MKFAPGTVLPPISYQGGAHAEQHAVSRSERAGLTERLMLKLLLVVGGAWLAMCFFFIWRMSAAFPLLRSRPISREPAAALEQTLTAGRTEGTSPLQVSGSAEESAPPALDVPARRRL